MPNPENTYIDPDDSNQNEIRVWDVICNAMHGTSIFTSNTREMLEVIASLPQLTKEMRPEFAACLGSAVASDLEQVTFCERGAVAKKTTHNQDAFEINLDIDRMKARHCRQLAKALREACAQQKV